MKRPLKVCFIADARSPIFRNWVQHFVPPAYDVHVISTYPCPPETLPGVALTQVPLIFSNFSRIGHDGVIRSQKRRSVFAPLLATLRSGSITNGLETVRYSLSPLALKRSARVVRSILDHLSPDIVHAMRIPLEGMLAQQSLPAGVPLVVSVWGNDFTLQAAKNRFMENLTRQTLRRADALFSDCERDLRRARQLGFKADKPALVLPGAGGIQKSLFSPGAGDLQLRSRLNIPENAPVVINPRGFRSYVRNDVFFEAIPHVLAIRPDAVFICTGMVGNFVAERWVTRYGIADNVRLLPTVPRDEMAGLFRLAEVSVSPSVHDGTPNTLLEAIACGCFPVAGDIESLREWLRDGVNGLLCDPTDAEALASRILHALQDKQLRESAKAVNTHMIAERADYDTVMSRVEAFYQGVVAERANGNPV